MKPWVKTLCSILLMSCLGFAGSRAGWIENGVPLTHQWGAAGGRAIATDGSSGAIVAYQACHEGVGRIIAQRVDSLGVVLWGEEGIDICTAPGDQQGAQITSDGAGGAIVTWQDFRNGNRDIYAQRVNASGAVQWTPNGVALCTAPGNQYPTITSDGAGGAIVMWEDYRSGSADIYAQRVNALGAIQWTANGVALCTATEDQDSPRISSDGAGGAIVTWGDNRSGNWQIYAQRVNGSGAVQWTADGVVLCTATSSPWFTPAAITSDGASGAIVTWQDYRGDGDIYAQRVNGSGAVQWTANGVGLCTATGNQYSPTITSDAAGGAVVTWMDSRSGYTDIYAQRVNASGAVQWTANGVALCAATGDQWFPTITSDGANGAIVTWVDYRNDGDIYAQRVNGSGAVQWMADGIGLCTATGNQSSPTITSDAAGGAIVMWQDSRNGNPGIYTQRMNASGAVQWTASGVALCAATGDQYHPTITSDGGGGAIVTWYDNRSGTLDIYAQRLNPSGAVQWVANGVALCAATGTQYDPMITSDGAGGAIVTWEDNRSGALDIYAQRLNSSGAVQWMVDGVALCTATGHQQSPQITSDGAGGAIVTWEDHRGYDSFIYAQRVSASGAVQWAVDGVALCTAMEDQYAPMITSDGAGDAIVAWRESSASGYSTVWAQKVNASGAVQWGANGAIMSTASLDQYSPTITSDGVGGAVVTWKDGRSGHDDIYAQRVNGSGAVQWTTDGIALCTAMGNQSQPTITSDAAGGAVVTWLDYRTGNHDIYAQKVNALGAVQWMTDGEALCTAPGDQQRPMITYDGAGGGIVAWEDHRCGGLIYAQRIRASGEIVATTLQEYSAALEGASIRLAWTLSEIDESVRFSIYRASGPDWEFIELKDATIDKDRRSFAFTDETCLPGSTYKYRVECEVAGAPPRVLFETESIAAPKAPLALYQNNPNPFNPSTTIGYYIPEKCLVKLDVFDVTGAWVARLVNAKEASGYHSVEWKGTNARGDQVASGVYFYRLTAGKRTVSKKMVLLK